MKKNISTGLALLCAVSIGLMIAGCSGGGNFTAAQPGVNTPALVTTVSGVAAAGAPIVGNAFLKDSSTPAVVKVVAINADGTFSFEVKALKAPFILRAEGISAGSPQVLHSFAAGAGTANINPLSEVALANAAGVSSPAIVYGNPTPAMLASIDANLPAAIAALQDKLKPLMDQYGASINPVYDSFAANHTGLDAMFDAVRITLASGNVMLTNKINNAVMLSASVNSIKGAALNMNALPPAPVPTPATPATSSLYDTNCAGCHGPLATSTKRGATAARIKSAISANTAGMGRFSTLSAADIQAIADALATTATPASPSAPPATSTPLDGVALYGTSCAGCHGQLTASTKKGRTSTQIQAAIDSLSIMNSLSYLSNSQVQAIADALGSGAQTTPPATTPPVTTPPTTTPTTPLDGATLYGTYCAGCHGALATSAKKGRTAAQIQAANSNVSAMSSLSSLNAGQIQAIATALAGGTSTPPTTPTTPPTTTPAPPDGTALYTANCSGCHGALANSSKRGTTVANIQSAISGNRGGMGFLSSLSVADLQAIVTALGTSSTTPTTPPATTDGATAYGTYCASCHGSLANSGVRGASATTIQSRIGSVSQMRSLSTLSAAQVQAIATALGTSSTTPTTPPATIDGATAYGTYCASCHGSLANSGVRGASATTIQSRIGSVSQMRSLSTLSAAQVQAIATALGTSSTTPSTPPPAATDGATLYGTSCASCHGQLVSSTKLNRTASQIQAAINNNSGGMGSLSNLSASQVQAIATALVSSTTAPTPACGSCHAIPPGTGHHSTHRSRSCATCHGTGYSTTTVNAATHNNGVKNIVTTIGWNASSRSCSNSCHGSESW